MDVGLFFTCLTDTFYRRVGEAVVRVLEHFGCRVDFPAAQTCCGQPMFNTGCHDDARALAKKMIEVFEKSTCVVTPSGSCCAMIRDYYPELFHDDPQWESRARALVNKTFEFSEFLIKKLKVDLPAAGCSLLAAAKRGADPLPTKMTYPYSCHLRGLAMTDEAVRLLRQIEGVEYVPLEKTEQCCGFGGTFAVKYPEISGALVRDKIDCIARSGAKALVCNDGGRALNIAGAMHRHGKKTPSLHIAQIIAQGLGLMPRELRT